MRAHEPNQAELPRRPASEWMARIDPIIYVTAARRLQARATAEAVSAGWHGIRRGLTSLARLMRRRLLEPIRRRAERQRALAELAAMEDRLLADIGLRRSDIELAVDGRLADPRVMRVTPAAARRRLEHEPAGSGVIAKADRPAAPARPDRITDLAA